MTIETALYSELSTTAEVTAVVSTRIFPQVAPLTVPYPFIVYSVINSIPEHHMGGASALTNVSLQLDVWAETVGELITIAEVLRNDLDGFRGDMGTENLDILSCFMDTRTTFEEPDPRGRKAPVFRSSLDFTIWHVSTVPTL